MAGDREQEAERSRKKALAKREIGPLPAVKNLRGRSKAEKSLAEWIRKYLPERVGLEWGEMHLETIARMQQACDEGVQVVVALPRGSGKTTIAEAAVLWAVLTGRRRYAVIVAATHGLAEARIGSILRELETPGALADAYPEACHAIIALERIHHRARGQLLDGQATLIELTKQRLVLPTVGRSRCSGSVIQAASLDGAIRGLAHRAPDGSMIRPDLVLIDDPQTRESAHSATQSENREQIINQDIMGLAGPTVRMASIALVTPICVGDLAERMLDKGRYPTWERVRIPAMPSMPDRMPLWDEYFKIWKEKGNPAAHAFYAANRSLMSEGAEVSWAARVQPGDLDAIETCMRVALSSPKMWGPEYQLRPADPADEVPNAQRLRASVLSERITGDPMGSVPPEAVRVTGGIDCGAERLHWVQSAWRGDGLGGVIIGYGTWPKESHRTLADLYPTLSEQARLYRAIQEMIASGAPPVAREGSEPEPVIWAVDAGWQMDIVRRACRAAGAYATRGFSRGSTGRGVQQWPTKAGEQKGHHWRRSREGLYVIDADEWRTMVADSLLLPAGETTALMLGGRSGGEHTAFLAHLTSEYSLTVESQGTKWAKWHTRPGQANHWWDALVYAAVAASIGGIARTAIGERPAAPKKRRSLSEAMAARGGIRQL